MAGGAFLGGGVARWGTGQPVYEKKYCWGFRSCILLMSITIKGKFGQFMSEL